MSKSLYFSPPLQPPPCLTLHHFSLQLRIYVPLMFLPTSIPAPSDYFQRIMSNSLKMCIRSYLSSAYITFYLNNFLEQSRCLFLIHLFHSYHCSLQSCSSFMFLNHHEHTPIILLYSMFSPAKYSRYTHGLPSQLLQIFVPMTPSVLKKRFTGAVFLVSKEKKTTLLIL